MHVNTEKSAEANEHANRLEKNLGVTIASLPVLRPLLASLHKLVKRKSESVSNKLRASRRNNAFRKSDRQKPVAKGVESDEHQLVKMTTTVDVHDTTEVIYEPPESLSMESGDSWAGHVGQRT